MRNTEVNWIQTLQEVLRSPWMDRFFIGWNYVDSLEFAILLIAFVWYLISRQIGVRLFYILTLSNVLNYFLKLQFDVSRPCSIDPSLGLICLPSPSFPSGAAQTAILIAGITFLESKNKILRISSIIFACFLSFSRVYLGVHYPTDILGGLVVGGLLLLVYKYLFPILEKYWKGSVFLFPILLLCIGQSKALLQFGISLGIGVGLLLSQPAKKKKWRLLQFFSAVLGVILILQGGSIYPGLKVFFASIAGLWFSIQDKWIPYFFKKV